jgi:hypothetical protein
LFLGAQKFGGKKSRRKACLSLELEGERYQYQRFISYLVVVDPAAHFNQPEEALCLDLGNKDGLQWSYGNQAVILQAWGRLEEAMALHKKQEALCRELGNKDGLQASYGNQPLIVKALGLAGGSS